MLNEFLIALFILLFFMVLSLVCVLCFTAGFIFKGKKKPKHKPQKPSEAEKRKAKRMQKENENFMVYSGIPQDAID